MGPGLLVKTSAPGSLMMMGEHAVLYHHRALVTAIDRRITVTLVQREDRKVLISSHIGTFRTDLDSLEIQTPFQFVLAAIASVRDKFSQGFELWIDSEFSHKVGFGSSAAVVVATLAAFEVFEKMKRDAEPYQGQHQEQKTHSHETRAQLSQDEKLALLAKAHAVIKKVQGLGSGSDAAASIFGGAISYSLPDSLHGNTNENLHGYKVEKLQALPPLFAVYSGSKIPTPLVIKQVTKAYHQEPKIFEHLFKGIDACSQSATIAIQNEDWLNLGQLMNIHQGLQSALGVSNKTLDGIIGILRSSKGIYGAKISGAGLGDCVIGLGKMSNDILEELQKNVIEAQYIPVQISSEGIKIE